MFSTGMLSKQLITLITAISRDVFFLFRFLNILDLGFFVVVHCFLVFLFRHSFVFFMNFGCTFSIFSFFPHIFSEHVLGWTNASFLVIWADLVRVRTACFIWYTSFPVNQQDLSLTGLAVITIIVWAIISLQGICKAIWFMHLLIQVQQHRLIQQYTETYYERIQYISRLFHM